MDKKIIKIVAVIMLFVFIVSGLSIWLYYRTPWREVVNQDNKTVDNKSTNGQLDKLTDYLDNGDGMNLEELAKHNVATDCYIVLNSNVYNATDLISNYPNTSDLIIYCGSGEEATPFFDANPSLYEAINSYWVNELSWSYSPDYADGSITLEEVAKHNIPQDCYLVIEGKVYDVTKYINSHPGGDEILRGCGKDATDLFVGKPHSDSAVDIKETYYIGDLAN